MFDSPEQLAAKIRLGEDSYLELKEVQLAGDKVSAPHRHGIADTLTAFANSKGGVCVLGVDDSSRQILELPDESEVKLTIFAADPAVAPVERRR